MTMRDWHRLPRKKGLAPRPTPPEGMVWYYGDWVPAEQIHRWAEIGMWGYDGLSREDRDIMKEDDG